jgi:hypothetical protein
MLPTFKHHRLIKWLVGLVMLVGLVLLSLPFAIQLEIERALTRLGADQASVKNVDFNPFVGELLIEGVEARAGEASPLLLHDAGVRIAWWPLWSRRVVIEELQVNGLQLAVSQAADGPLQISGLTLPSSEAGKDQAGNEAPVADQRWGFGVRHFQFQASDVRYHSEQLDVALRVDDFELNRLLSFAEAFPASARFAGAIKRAPLDITFQGTPFSETRHAKLNIGLQDFELAGLNQMLPPTIKALKGRLGIDLELAIEQNPKGDFKLAITGKTKVSDYAVQIPEQQIATSHESLAWQGGFKLQQQGEKLSWQFDGDVNSTNSAVQQLVNGKPEPLFAAAAMGINGLALSAKPSVSATPDVLIDRIQLDSVKLQLHKTKEGKLQLPGETAKSSDNGSGDVSKPVAKTDTPSTTPTFRLGQFSVGGDSVLQFTDDSVRPQFKLNLQLRELSLGELDNTKPKQPTTLKLVGKPDKFSELRFDGKIYPFNDKLTLELAGKISSLELPPLSSYTAPVLGYNLASGQLDAELDFKVEQGVINSENKLKINQLTLDPSDPETAAKFSKRLSMPLDAALSLLRDKEDNIRLKLPISGDLENPKFDIADAINQSLSTAMKFAAMSYIKLALQPFGTFVSIYQVAGSAGKMVNTVRLDPVNFGAGRARLDEESETYLQSTIKLLESRPKLNLKICGMATRADLASIAKKRIEEAGAETTDDNGETNGAPKTEDKPPALTEKQEKILLKLARERSLAIKNYLVTEGEIAAKSLFICNPEIDLDEAAVPRAELRI